MAGCGRYFGRFERFWPFLASLANLRMARFRVFGRFWPDWAAIAGGGAVAFPEARVSARPPVSVSCLSSVAVPGAPAKRATALLGVVLRVGRAFLPVAVAVVSYLFCRLALDPLPSPLLPFGTVGNGRFEPSGGEAGCCFSLSCSV